MLLSLGETSVDTTHFCVGRESLTLQDFNEEPEGSWHSHVSFGERPLEKQLETKSIACPPHGKQSGVHWLNTVLNSECGLVIGSVPICICCFHGSVT